MLLAHPSSVSSNVCGDGGSIKSIQDSEDIKWRVSMFQRDGWIQLLHTTLLISHDDRVWHLVNDDADDLRP